MRTCDDLRGGLNSIAAQLGMERVHGPAHQARSPYRRVVYDNGKPLVSACTVPPTAASVCGA